MQKEYEELTKNLKEKINMDTFKNEKGAHHINKDENKKEKKEVINNFLKKEKTYLGLELSTEELLNLFENFIFEYQKATNASKIKPEFYIEKWASGIYHNWLTIENLCAMRGYFNAQKAKNQQVEYFKAFTRLIDSVQIPSDDEPGKEAKLNQRDIFISTYAKQGYTWYFSRIMPEKQRKMVDDKEEQEKLKSQQQHEFTQKYWVKLTEIDPLEADNIANKADILFNTCYGSPFIKLLDPGVKKGGATESSQKHIEKIRFACISAELEKNALHSVMLNLKKMPIRQKKNEVNV